MPHKRSTPSTRRGRGVRPGPPLPPWRELWQQAFRARQAGAWPEVGRLLPLLATASDHGACLSRTSVITAPS